MDDHLGTQVKYHKSKKYKEVLRILNEGRSNPNLDLPMELKVEKIRDRTERNQTIEIELRCRYKVVKQAISAIVINAATIEIKELKL